MSQLSETVTLQQLADHNTLESLWIAVHGHVYDLTTFSSDHPGGIEALEISAGTDGTESYDYAGHSESNMSKMQHYRLGSLSGSIELASPLSHNPLVERSKQLKSAISRLQQSRLSRWTKPAVTTLAISLVVALSYYIKDDLAPHISPDLNVDMFQLGNLSDHKSGHAFLAGIAIASSASFLSFRYLYKLFLTTLDYQNDVFSFPPTIPRRVRR